jgi:polysaccharide export outer membrane protein
MQLTRHVLFCACLALAGCGTSEQTQPLVQAAEPTSPYIIGPLDNLEIFVWRSPELTMTVAVRPDGRISVPLTEDMVAVGKTPTQLARDIERNLRRYIQDPTVTVIMSGFVGPFDQQIRIVGEATDPAAIPYRANMTLLDVMIQVKGLTRFAAGNRAQLVRNEGGKQTEIPVRLDDLIKDGDVGANVPVQPGDILIIPQAWF